MDLGLILLWLNTAVSFFALLVSIARIDFSKEEAEIARMVALCANSVTFAVALGLALIFTF